MIDPIDQELAASYALDLLASPRRADFEQAMQARPELRQLVRDFQDVTDALALDCPAQRIPAETWNRIQLQVEWDRERIQTQEGIRRRTRWTIAGWAAAAVLALGWSWSWWHPAPDSARPVEIRSDGSNVGKRTDSGPARLNSATRALPASPEQIAPKDVPRTDPAMNLLRAQLDAARAREQRWSQALDEALSQITNLASQLEAEGTVVPGLRHTRWFGLAPPGQAHLADHAIETILSQLPGILTNLTGSMQTAGPFDSTAGGNQPPDQAPNRIDETPVAPGEINGPVGVALWDGRSPTMMVAFAGVEAPPNGQLVLWGNHGAGQVLAGTPLALNSPGALQSPNGVHGHVVLVPAPAPGSPAATPRLFVTLEPVGVPLVAPSGPVVIRTP